jgi:hypothetical protein
VPLDDLSDLSGFVKGKLPVDYPKASQQTFFSGDDMVDSVLTNMVHSAETSLVMSRFGLTPELAAIVIAKLNDKNVYVQLSLPAVTRDEYPLIAKLGKLSCNSVAFGLVGFAALVVDGMDVVDCGDRTVTVTRHPIIAHRWRTKMDLIHRELRDE